MGDLTELKSYLLDTNAFIYPTNPGKENKENKYKKKLKMVTLFYVFQGSCKRIRSSELFSRR
jgi:hypothetical protein